MGVLNGEVFQLAYVVEDLDAALDHWINTLGVGPFFNFPLPLDLEWLELNGARTSQTDILSGAALAQNGAVQIELLCPGPDSSPYRDFLDRGRQGVHHLGMYAQDYEREMAEVRAAGIGVAMEGLLPLSRFSYLRTDETHAGTMIELIDATPEMRALFDMIAQTSRGWDGENPVRELG